MNLKILVTAGDGIGPEVTNEAVAVLKEVAAIGGHTLEFDARRIGGVAIVQDGTPLPADTLAAAPTSGPRQACCKSARRWAASLICAPPSPSKSLR
jgi:isocitrate/isopropylmalate dehydrogenase